MVMAMILIAHISLVDSMIQHLTDTVVRILCAAEKGLHSQSLMIMLFILLLVVCLGGFREDWGKHGSNVKI